MSPYNVTTHKAWNFSNTTVRTSNYMTQSSTVTRINLYSVYLFSESMKNKHMHMAYGELSSFSNAMYESSNYLVHTAVFPLKIQWMMPLTQSTARCGNELMLWDIHDRKHTYHDSKLMQVHKLQLMYRGSSGTCTSLLQMSAHMNWNASPNTADISTKVTIMLYPEWVRIMNQRKSVIILAV